MTQRRLAALIGTPVEHSLSPVIHQAAFDAAGVGWDYAAFEVAAGRAAEGVLRVAHGDGVYLTARGRARGEEVTGGC